MHTPVSKKKRSPEDSKSPDRQKKARRLFDSDSNSTSSDLLLQNNKFLANLTAKFDTFSNDIGGKLVAIKEMATQNQFDIAEVKVRLNSLESRPENPILPPDEIVELRRRLERIESREVVPPAKVTDLDARLEQLESTNNAGTSLPTNLINRIDSLEEYTERLNRMERRSELIVSNILVAVGETVNCRDIFLKICKYLRIRLPADGISQCRVLNSERKGKSGGTSGATSVLPEDWNYMDFLVKLRSNEMKSSVMSAYLKDLKINNKDLGLSEMRHRVYLNDNLTKSNFAIYKKAKELFKIKHNSDKKLVDSVYTSFGQVYVRKLDKTVHRVLTLKELDEIRASISDSSSSSE